MTTDITELAQRNELLIANGQQKEPTNDQINHNQRAHSANYPSH